MLLALVQALLLQPFCLEKKEHCSQSHPPLLAFLSPRLIYLDHFCTALLHCGVQMPPGPIW